MPTLIHKWVTHTHTHTHTHTYMYMLSHPQTVSLTNVLAWGSSSVHLFICSSVHLFSLPLSSLTWRHQSLLSPSSPPSVVCHLALNHRIRLIKEMAGERE